MIACYYHDMINMYKQSYSDEELQTYYQLDVTKSLKTQPYPYDESLTWYDAMMDSAKNTIEQQLLMYEAATEAGFTMPEKDQEMVEAALAEVDLAEYGNGVTMEDVRRTMEIQALSTAYYYQMMEELKPSEEEIRALYEENPKNYETCGLAGFPVSYTADEEGETPLTQDEAKKIADELAAVKNVKEFEKMASQILLEHEGYTQEEVDVNLPSIYNDAYTYTENNNLAEWAFGGAKVNDTFDITESCPFATVATMIDASRGFVPTVSSVKKLIDRLALMGYNMMMLYTEDTVELEDRPFFGYMRGRYTKEELREIDD
jgi:hypothetical protein